MFLVTESLDCVDSGWRAFHTSTSASLLSYTFILCKMLCKGLGRLEHVTLFWHCFSSFLILSFDTAHFDGARMRPRGKTRIYASLNLSGRHFWNYRVVASKTFGMPSHNGAITWLSSFVRMSESIHNYLWKVNVLFGIGTPSNATKATMMMIVCVLSSAVRRTLVRGARRRHCELSERKRNIIFRNVE